MPGQSLSDAMTIDREEWQRIVQDMRVWEEELDQSERDWIVIWDASAPRK